MRPEPTNIAAGSLLAFGAVRPILKSNTCDTFPHLAFVSAAFTRADHEPLVRCFVATDIDHGLNHVRLTTDAVWSRPKKQVARLEGIKLETSRCASTASKVLALRTQTYCSRASRGTSLIPHCEST